MAEKEIQGMADCIVQKEWRKSESGREVIQSMAGYQMSGMVGLRLGCSTETFFRTISKIRATKKNSH